MPYTVTEYAGRQKQKRGHGRILATFASAHDAVAYAMDKCVKRIPPQHNDLVTLYQGARSDDNDSPWLVVEVSR